MVTRLSRHGGARAQRHRICRHAARSGGLVDSRGRRNPAGLGRGDGAAPVTDDAPFGGGGGMILKPEPLAAASSRCGPRGRGCSCSTRRAAASRRRSRGSWPRRPHLVLVCGRYEGVDERVRELMDGELSIGDYVLTGGELRPRWSSRTR